MRNKKIPIAKITSEWTLVDHIHKGIPWRRPKQTIFFQIHRTRDSIVGLWLPTPSKVHKQAKHAKLLKAPEVDINTSYPCEESRWITVPSPTKPKTNQTKTQWTPPNTKRNWTKEPIQSPDEPIPIRIHMKSNPNPNELKPNRAQTFINIRFHLNYFHSLGIGPSSQLWTFILFVLFVTARNSWL